MLPGFRNWCAGCFLVEYLLFGKTDDRRLLSQSHFPKAVLLLARSRKTHPAMASGPGRNFRTDNVGTAMDVRHIVFRLG